MVKINTVNTAWNSSGKIDQKYSLIIGKPPKLIVSSVNIVRSKMHQAGKNMLKNDSNIMAVAKDSSQILHGFTAYYKPISPLNLLGEGRIKMHPI